MAAQNEKLRVVVVGGVAGGASAAARVKRLNENADVVVFEKGSDVSFSNCGLPYYLSGTVEDSEDLIMMTPAAFRKKHDIDVRVHSEVVSIDREKKTVTRAQHGDRRDVWSSPMTSSSCRRAQTPSFLLP